MKLVFHKPCSRKNELPEPEPSNEEPIGQEEERNDGDAMKEDAILMVLMLSVMLSVLLPIMIISVPSLLTDWSLVVLLLGLFFVLPIALLSLPEIRKTIRDAVCV